tara:strand:+ start:291 stop:479 length:189 start_codon:yes stop_codon:yes gene_type:complete
LWIIVIVFESSEKRDSNPRPPPWQGGALPTELFSQLNEHSSAVKAVANLKLLKQHQSIFKEK